MSFCPTVKSDLVSWNYLTRTFDEGFVISVERFLFLRYLAYKNDGLVVSLRDPHKNFWSKWSSIYDCEDKGGRSVDELQMAYEIHRSLLSNEIVIESDYPTYEENVKAMRLIGGILEDKGFRPEYYFSGNKSIHAHIFFDKKCLSNSDLYLQQQIIEKFKNPKIFWRSFVKWLRKELITGFGVCNKNFDTGLISGRHLIRSEMSKNKKGYKTYLGGCVDSISVVPYYCNPENGLAPKIGSYVLSSPHSPQELLEEFLLSYNSDLSAKKISRKEKGLGFWMKKRSRPSCIEYLLSDDFAVVGDGHRRAMFIIANDMKIRDKVGVDELFLFLRGWCDRVGASVSDFELQYICRSKSYSLGCSYVHDFLDSIGLKRVVELCN